MAFIVAIDGLSGTGKGTITKLLAKKYKLLNVDTGGLYRCVALEMLNKKIDVGESDKISEMLKSIDIKMEVQKEKLQFFLNGENVSDKIRTEEVSKYVSVISTLKEIRESVTSLERKIAQNSDVVMEGRDIGTVVFPNANVKIYLDASSEERARRRFKQNQEKGIESTYEEVLQALKERDERDSSRDIAALKVAKGAVVVDSTNMTIKQVQKTISKIIDKELKKIKQNKKVYEERKETVIKKVERKIIKTLINCFYVTVFRMKKINANKLPTDEPVIICANHLNTMDAIGLVCSNKVKINFVVKEELFRNPFIAHLGKTFDVIPIKRGMRDMEAMKRCLKTLKDGKNLGLFPEGTRKGLEKGAKVQNGAVFMAIKSKVKIVPVGISGDFKPFGRVYYNYGDPIDFSKYDNKYPEKDKLELATKELMDQIVMLTKNCK